MLKVSICGPGAVFLLATLFVAPINAQTFQLIGKAQPDEFYNGLGNKYIPLGTEGPNDVGIPKVNQDYVWGMATEGDYIWFGTGGNTVAQATATTLSGGTPQEFTDDNGNPFRAWEFGISQFPLIPEGLRPVLGDWRPPEIWQYDMKNNVLVNRTPVDRLINYTLGIRSAGVHRGVALMAGSSVLQVGMNVFAFDAQTGQFLGSRFFARYSLIRRWAVAQGELYTSAQYTFPLSHRGTVLRWAGSKAAPFLFEEVGLIDNAGSYLTAHDGRLFVGTWAAPTTFELLGENFPDLPAAGVWMSPKIPARGLRSYHRNAWNKVWSADDYEPDPVLARSYAMGAMESYNGSLYFGTMHFPSLTNFVFGMAYPGAPQPGAKLRRVALVLRGSNFDSSSGPSFDLLYGNAEESFYTSTGPGTGSWSTKPNNTSGSDGIYGRAGFGNNNNFYIWSSSVHGGKLYFGTYDNRSVDGLIHVLNGSNLPEVGGDLWCIGSSNSAAVAIDVGGCGNPSNHGIRTMVTTPYGLFLGMANNANLLTEPVNNPGNLGLYPRPVLGGWELLRLINP